MTEAKKTTAAGKTGATQLYVEVYKGFGLDIVAMLTGRQMDPQADIRASAWFSKLKLATAHLPNPKDEKERAHMLESIKEPILTAAELSLVPGADFTIIPFKTKQPSGEKYYELALNINKGGYLKVLNEAEALSAYWPPRVVWKCDEFKMELGTHPRLHHVPKPWPSKDYSKKEKCADNMVGAYMCYRLKGSTDIQFLFMDIEALLERRDMIKRKEDGTPWFTHLPQMCLVTIIREAAKMFTADRIGKFYDEMGGPMDPPPALPIKKDDQLPQVEQPKTGEELPPAYPANPGMEPAGGQQPTPPSGGEEDPMGTVV